MTTTIGGEISSRPIARLAREAVRAAAESFASRPSSGIDSCCRPGRRCRVGVGQAG